jgi:hypothetical protein
MSPFSRQLRRLYGGAEVVTENDIDKIASLVRFVSNGT